MILWFLCSLLCVPMPGWYPKLPFWGQWELQMPSPCTTALTCPTIPEARSTANMSSKRLHLERKLLRVLKFRAWSRKTKPQRMRSSENTLANCKAPRRCQLNQQLWHNSFEREKDAEVLQSRSERECPTQRHLRGRREPPLGSCWPRHAH